MKAKYMLVYPVKKPLEMKESTIQTNKIALADDVLSRHRSMINSIIKNDPIKPVKISIRCTVFK